MRVLEALKILEAAALECPQRSIDTPEVWEALHILERFVVPDYLVPRFRQHLTPANRRDFYLEQQQHVLKLTFSRIHSSIRRSLERQVERLNLHAGRGDECVGSELERLSTALKAMPKRWMLY
jgi:hypothetical protein